MTFAEHLRILRDRWWILIVLAILGAVAGYGIGWVQPNAFRSTVEVALGPRPTPGGTLSDTTNSLKDRSITSTMAQIVQSTSVVDAASERTGLSVDAFDVEGLIVNNANVVAVNVTSPTPADSRTYAEEVATLATAQFERLYPQFRAVVISPARDGASVRLPTVLAVVPGALVGLFIGHLIALAAGPRERRRP